MKKAVHERLEGDFKVAITTDMWSSLHMEGYITVTYLKDWKSHSLMLGIEAVPERHNAQTSLSASNTF